MDISLPEKIIISKEEEAVQNVFGTPKKTIEEFKAEVEELGNHEYIVLNNVYNGRLQKVLFLHTKCNRTYLATPNKFLYGRRCPYCSHGSKRKSTEEYINEVRNINPNIQVLGKYERNNKPILMRSINCGHEFETSPINFRAHPVCPICSNKRSLEEIEISKFIRSIYSGQIIQNYKLKQNNKTLEIDIYVPERKLGIEFNGLYWHSDAKVDKLYHYNKMKFFESAGIQLIQIFEDEWIEHKNEIKNFFIRIFNINKLNIDACTTEIKEGEINLFYNSEIVAQLKYDDNQIIFLEYSKYNIENAFGYLLDIYINIENPKTISTIADLRWVSENKNIYLNNGFNFQEYLPPDFMYTQDRRRFKENIQNKKYRRIWDCGKAIFVLERNDLDG